MLSGLLHAAMSFTLIRKCDNTGLSLIRINHEDDNNDAESSSTKMKTKSTASWIQQAEHLLMQQWPRGGPYKEKLIYTHASVNSLQLDSSNYYALPCSYVMVERKDEDNSNSIVVGHGRLTECFESAGGNAVAATFIVISKAHRGCGLGSVMMQLLEQEAERLGYHYVYLWTQTAIEFYQKIGYTECQRVSLKRACLKSLQPNQVDGLEAMLLRKSQESQGFKAGTTTETTPKETILLPPEEGEEKVLEDVWLRKRLVEHVGSIHIADADRIKEIETFIMDQQQHDNMSNRNWYYRLLSLPWQAQIGPSCGLAALRMVREYFLSLSDTEAVVSHQLPSLLGEAQERGYTKDGEVFNANHLMDLATSVCGIETELWPTSEASAPRLENVLASGGVFVLPYDSKPGAFYPVKLSGQRAHYGVIVGILFSTPSNDCDGSKLVCLTNLPTQPKNDPVSAATAMDEVSAGVFLIVQHSLSQNLSIAPMDQFWKSNQQLLSFDEGKFGIQDLDLKNRLIVCKRPLPR